MRLFITVLVEGEYIQPILKKFKDNNFHGAVLSTRSIRHALEDSVEPLPYFGGINKVIDGEEEVARPMIFSVIEDEDVKVLAGLVNNAIGTIKGKGFMYSLPIDYIEGLE